MSTQNKLGSNAGAVQGALMAAKDLGWYDSVEWMLEHPNIRNVISYTCNWIDNVLSA